MPKDIFSHDRFYAIRDLSAIGIAFAGAFIASDRLELFARIVAADNAAPQWHIDDIIIAMIVSAIAGWYVWRRWRAMRRESAALMTMVHEVEARNQTIEKTSRELAAARDAAEAASRTKSEFLNNMSHELRTPLNAIIGFSNMMISRMFGPLGSDEYAEFVDYISWSANRLLSLVNDILDFSNIESGRFAVRAAKCDVGDILSDAADRMRSLAETGAVDLVCQAGRGQSPADAALNIRADQAAVRRLLLNILSNAIKFTPKGGRVMMGAVQNSSTTVELYVADTGIGMSPREVELALQGFQQVDSSTARKYEGAGLGLPIAQAIAVQHGGHLEIRSTPGEGTRVSAILPVWSPKDAMQADMAVSTA